MTLPDCLTVLSTKTRFLAASICLIVLAGCMAQQVAPTVTPSIERTPVVFSAELHIVEHPSNQTGKLYFFEARPRPNYRIAEIDMPSGAIRTIFSAPSRAVIRELAADPSNNRLILAYTAPVADDATRFDRSGLYSLELNGTAQPQRLIGDDQADIFYYEPTVAADGSFVIFLRYSPHTETNLFIERYDFESGAVTTIAENAVEPALSPDGNALAMIARDSETQAQSLIVSDVTGQNQRTLIAVDQFADVEQPRFSADSRWVYFIALEQSETVQHFDWVALLSGASVAEAHGNHAIPGDWWRVPTVGGEPERVTNLGEIINSAETGPNDKTLAFATRTGLYLVANDETLPLIKSRAIFNITWMR